MGKSIAVHTAQLRSGAAALLQVCELRGGPVVEPERLGSHRLSFAFERFEEYWHTGRMDLTENVQAMHAVLRSSAGEYERRDAEDAEGFDRSVRAI